MRGARIGWLALCALALVACDDGGAPAGGEDGGAQDARPMDEDGGRDDAEADPPDAAPDAADRDAEEADADAPDADAPDGALPDGELPDGALPDGELPDADPDRLLRITLDPETLALIAGEAAPMRATGHYADGTEADVTEAARWQSSAPGVAAVGQLVAEGRQIVGLEAGEAEVSAQIGDVVGAAPVVVEAVAPVALRVAPEMASIAAGETVSLRAWATYNDGTEAEVTGRAEWRSANPIVAAPVEGAPGRIMGHAEGATRVTALFEGLVSLPVAIEVTAPALRTLTITPPAPSGAIGERIRFTATGTLSDGTLADLSAEAEWSSSDPAIATVDGGAAELLAVGVARISARVGEVAAEPATLTVHDARVIALTVAGDVDALVVGGGTILRATARLSDGTDAAYGDRVEWRSSDEAVLRIGVGGMATAVGPGVADVTAHFGDVASGPYRIAVEAVALVGLVVDPEQAVVAVGESVQLGARGLYNDGTEAEVGAQAEWQSANPVVATVGDGAEAGLVRGLAPGQTRITARLGGFAASATVDVEAAPLVAVEVAPAAVALPAGAAQDFTATAIYGDGGMRDVTGQAEWRVTGPLALGEGPARSTVTALAEGEGTVVATLDGVDSAPAIVTVRAAEVVRLRVEPAAPRIIVGEAFQLAAFAEFSDGGERDITEEAVWTISDEAVATVSNQPGSRGRVDALAVGEAAIRVTFEALLSPPAALTVLPVPNRAPIVEIDCPETGREGEALDFSSRGSSDPDGRIVRYVWTFGDAAPLDVGDTVDISYSFETSGLILVELTAEDDEGARATARCEVAVQSAGAPTVRFVRPQGVRPTTQGAEIDVLVDARPGPGRAITGVSLLLDGDEVATAEVAPYEMTVTVPLDAATGATLRLVARAVDDVGETGQSAAVLLDVQNDLPVPNFVAVPTDVRSVTVDASGVTDDTTDAAALEVRWDWEDDGIYDTAFSADKLAAHDYPEQGEYTIRMQVRDNVGQTASSTRRVRLVDRQVVSGDIESQVWAGTILVTGDVRLLPGHTLTVVAGTSVQVVRVDQDGNGIGDYDIVINGELRVQGEPDAPVVFTVFGADDRAPAAWQGLDLNGDRPSSVRHAVVEFAHTGIMVRDDSVIEDTLVQQTSQYGIRVIGDGGRLDRVTINDSGHTALRLSGADDVTVDALRVSGAASYGIDGRGSNVAFTGLDVRDGGDYGIYWQGGSLTMDGGAIADNGCHGLHVDDGMLDAIGLRIEGNGCNGALLRGDTRGLLTRSHVIGNDEAGVAVVYHDGRDPSVAVVRNNIHSNAAEGATRFDFAVSPISANDRAVDGRWAESAVWRAPAGSRVRSVETSFQISNGYNGSGQLLNGGTRAQITSFSNASGSRVVSTDVSSFIVGANLSECCNGSATMRLDRVYYSSPGGAAQLVVARASGTVDARENYLGRYPDVLPAVAFSSSGAVNLEGFVGVPYDDDFDTGPYYGGRTIEEPIEWSGVVYISGDVLIGAGGGLTVAPGTEIRVAPHDQNGNGLGDFSLQIDGPSVIEGTAEAPIVFRTDGDSAPDDWDRLHLQGDDISVAHTRVEGAHIGLIVVGDDITVRDFEARRNAIGVEVRGGAPLFERLDAHDNASHGIVNRGGATMNLVRSEDNGGYGIWLDGAAATLADVLVRANGEDGVRLDSPGHTLSQIEITDNVEHGIDAFADGGGTVRACVVTFNGGAGVHALSDDDTHPLLAVTGCNVFGNAAQEGGVGVRVYREDRPVLRATDRNVDGRWTASAVWQAPAQPFQVNVGFDIRNGYNGTGQLLNAASNSQLFSANSTQTRWLDTNATRFITQANLSECCNGTASMTLYDVRQYTEGQQGLELSVGVFAVGRIDARGNYWGVFPAVQARIAEAREGSVDFSGFLPDPVRDVGPRALP